MADDSIIIQIDPDLAEMVPEYLNNRKKEIITLKEAVAAKDFQKLKVLGHRMKGNAGGYGFEQIGAFGAELENAASTNNELEVQRIIQNLNSHLDKIKLVNP